ncbi:unnamed protein product [Dicrocoelium dendriticum]|nr:unnamed protein product [Dicrocoelium dendriticum]
MLSLMRMLRLIFSYSTHYRSPTNMTILFMKITKQLIKRCMEYLTENGMVSIWNQPTDVMLTKLNYCVSLNESYQAAYDKISQEDDPKGKYTKMEFSRIQIFGDFDSFITRVKALTFIMENLQKYTAIEHLGVEGKMAFG